MRNVIALALCAFALPVAAAAPPAPAPLAVPPVMATRPPIPGSWEEIPPAVRARLERQVRPLAFQAVLRIEPVALSGEPKAVEAGTRLLRQEVSPARAVKLTSAPRRAYYGEIGSVLWQVRDESSEYWCRLSAFNLSTGYNYYCFQDTNNDGTFDALYEANYSMGYLGFQTFGKGHDEDLRKPVTYAPADPPQDHREYVALTYRGVHAGLIADDGFVRPGLVKLDLVVGVDSADPRQRGERLVKTYDVELNQQGRAQVELPSGYRVTIDSVEVGGRARIAVSGGMPQGEGYLFPAVTRDDLLKRYQRALGAAR